MPEDHSDEYVMAVHRGPSSTDALEPAFWQMFIDIAETQGVALSQLMADIDRMRSGHSQASAIRCYVLKYVFHQSTLPSDSSHRLTGRHGTHGGSDPWLQR